MDTTPKLPQPFYWHKYNDEWQSCTLEVHITKEPHLYQQQAWLETYEPMI
jgi:hypothetical protein